MRQVPAYFLGGPMDLTKKMLASDLLSVRFPSMEFSYHIGAVPVDIPQVKTHHYRRVMTELDEEIAVFIYEGTW